MKIIKMNVQPKKNHNEFHFIFQNLHVSTFPCFNVSNAWILTMKIVANSVFVRFIRVRRKQNHVKIHEVLHTNALLNRPKCTRCILLRKYSIHHLSSRFDGVSAPVFIGGIANHVKHISQVFSLFPSLSPSNHKHHTVIPFDIRGSRYHLEWRSLKGKSFKFQTMLYNLIYFCCVFPFSVALRITTNPIQYKYTNYLLVHMTAMQKNLDIQH